MCIRYTLCDILSHWLRLCFRDHKKKKKVKSDSGTPRWNNAYAGLYYQLEPQKLFPQNINQADVYEDFIFFISL